MLSSGGGENEPSSPRFRISETEVHATKWHALIGQYRSTGHLGRLALLS